MLGVKNDVMMKAELAAKDPQGTHPMWCPGWTGWMSMVSQYVNEDYFRLRFSFRVDSWLTHHVLVGGLEHEFYGFPYIGNNHPN